MNLVKKTLTILLCAAMVITYMPTNLLAYAEAGPDQVQVEQQADVEEPAEEAPVVEATEEEAPAVETPTETESTPTAEEAAAEEAPPEETAEPAGDEPQAEAEAEKTEEEVKEEFAKGDLKAGNGRYDVVVSFGEDAEIPEGAKLALTEFSEDDKEYKDAKSALISDVKGNSPFSQASKEAQEQLGMAAFDLTIYDKDGKAIEPKGPVTVNVELKSLPEGVDAESLAKTMQIQHLDESKGDVVVEKVATVDTLEAKANDDIGAIAVNERKETAEAEFTVESFSTYTVTWNTGSATVHYGYMNGTDVFSFTITQMPKLIKNFPGKVEMALDQYDALILHQANLYIMQQISKKTKVPMEKIPISIDRYGNTSGTSIPITLCDADGEKSGQDQHLLMCGYGIGLSWGVLDFEIDTEDIYPIITTDLTYDDGYEN